MFIVFGALVLSSFFQFRRITVDEIGQNLIHFKVILNIGFQINPDTAKTNVENKLNECFKSCNFTSRDMQIKNFFST